MVERTQVRALSARMRARVPARARPFVRLAVVSLLVLLGNTATAQFIQRDATWSMPFVTVVRLVASLPILRYPLPGFILSFEVDKWDWFWLGMGEKSADAQEAYQHWDKAVDLACLAIAGIVVVTWPDARARVLALGALAWRAIGVVAYFASDQRWLLAIFPNVFESIFLLYVVFRLLTGHQRMLESRKAMVLVSIALLAPKVTMETFLHVLNERPWDRFELISGDFSFLDAWIWGAALYLLPVIALVVLTAQAHGRATHGDPEGEVSAV